MIYCLTPPCGTEIQLGRKPIIPKTNTWEPPKAGGVGGGGRGGGGGGGLTGGGGGDGGGLISFGF